jgi:hypothetical protein
MTTEEGASGGRVTFRTPRPPLSPGPPWVGWSVFAVVWLVSSPGALWKGQPETAATYLALSCCWGALAWLSRKSGVELTPESVIVRRLSLAENCVVARTSSGPPQEFGRLVRGPAPPPGRQAGKAAGSGRR